MKLTLSEIKTCLRRRTTTSLIQTHSHRDKNLTKYAMANFLASQSRFFLRGRSLLKVRPYTLASDAIIQPTEMDQNAENIALKTPKVTENTAAKIEIQAPDASSVDHESGPIISPLLFARNTSTTTKQISRAPLLGVKVGRFAPQRIWMRSTEIDQSNFSPYTSSSSSSTSSFTSFSPYAVSSHTLSSHTLPHLDASLPRVRACWPCSAFLFQKFFTILTFLAVFGSFRSFSSVQLFEPFLANFDHFRVSFL